MSDLKERLAKFVLGLGGSELSVSDEVQLKGLREELLLEVADPGLVAECHQIYKLAMDTRAQVQVRKRNLERKAGSEAFSAAWEVMLNNFKQEDPG